MKALFRLEQHDTTVRQEIAAGMTGFFTIVYIIVVNSLILSESGMPLEGAVLATILTSFVGCVLMGLWGNAPILMIPGMGINAMFTYTLVGSMGLTWQEALGVVVVSGILLTVISFSVLARWISDAIPDPLKEAIGIGIGMFLILLGLENGGLIVNGESSVLALGDFSDSSVQATIITFTVALVLYIKNVKGHFLWTILTGVGVAYLLGVLPSSGGENFSLQSYGEVFGAFTLEYWLKLPFIAAVFSITMVVLFENISLITAHTSFAGDLSKFKKSFQASSISVLLSGVFGSSPTVATAESTAAIAAGGRTGLTSITTGLLFLGTIFFIPYIHLIPPNAVAPILIIIGGLMVKNITNLVFKDNIETIASIFTIVMIPFTFSIADGIAIGFILYAGLKLAAGKVKDVSIPLYVIAGLFLLYFILPYV
jgi:AGZA family xanthine/uracil permease-like MFS transporter